jgi:hypothetical protein
LDRSSLAARRVSSRLQSGASDAHQASSFLSRSSISMDSLERTRGGGGRKYAITCMAGGQGVQRSTLHWSTLVNNGTAAGGQAMHGVLQ